MTPIAPHHDGSRSACPDLPIAKLEITDVALVIDRSGTGCALRWFTVGAVWGGAWSNAGLSIVALIILAGLLGAMLIMRGLSILAPELGGLIATSLALALLLAATGIAYQGGLLKRG